MRASPDLRTPLTAPAAPAVARTARRSAHRMRPPGLPLLALAAVLLLACHGERITGPVAPGTWGGPQGNLAVYADSATLDLPCAAGRIAGPLVVAADGTFDLTGLYAVQAGPIGIEGADWREARYSGRRAGDRIELSITLPDDGQLGPLRFERGVVGQFPRCL